MTEEVKPSGLQPAPFGALQRSLNERPAVPKEVRGRSADRHSANQPWTPPAAPVAIVVNTPITIAAPTRVRANCGLQLAPAGLLRFSGPSMLGAGSIAAPATSPTGRFEAVAGDVRDPQGVREAMRGCLVVLRLAALIAKSVFGHLAGYGDVNDADQLRHDPAMRLSRRWQGRTVWRGVAEPNGPFQTGWRAFAAPEPIEGVVADDAPRKG